MIFVLLLQVAAIISLKKTFKRLFQKRDMANYQLWLILVSLEKIDPNISEIDNLFLFNVDDLDSVMEQNRESRK